MESNHLPTTELIGQSLGDYTLIRRLGSGGMADVYLAEQASLKRYVAFKVLKPELSKDAAYVQRFAREAQAAAALVQNSIVQIYEVGQVSGIHFIAQEYVPGRNLKQFIVRHGAVEPAMALNVLRQTAMALQKAAEHGVIHRDIKPENIMIGTSGEVKVTDFGLARLANDSARMDLTQIGVTMGTPLYMSPEQVEGRNVDPRSDIYSLGITSFHMLAGHPPFDGDTALAVALKQVNSPSPELRAIRPDVPVELAALIKKMMEKNPDHRIQDASELLREIRKIKIDLDDGWDSLAEKLASSDQSFAESGRPAHTAKLAVTRQLQTVMGGNIRSWWSTPIVLSSLVALSLLGAAGGFALARFTPPDNPLDVDYKSVTEIGRMKDVVEQYRAAFWGRTPEHYEAVINYFPLESTTPENRTQTLVYHRRALLRMGEAYLINKDIAQAETCFESLYDVEEAAREFRVAGAAGLAYVAHLTGEPDPKVRMLLKVVEPELDLLDETLRGYVYPLMSDSGNDSKKVDDQDKSGK